MSFIVQTPEVVAYLRKRIIQKEGMHGMQIQQLNCECDNRKVHIRHQCRKTTVLSCHSCLINTGVEKMNYI